MDKSKIDINAINEKIKKESSFIDLLIPEVNKVIVGQKYMIERLLIGLLGRGHILLEGVPGLAKTLAINTLSQVSTRYSSEYHKNSFELKNTLQFSPLNPDSKYVFETSLYTDLIFPVLTSAICK